MKNDKIISVMGIVWLILWLSHIPLLVHYYPRQERIESLINEVWNTPDVIRKEAGFGDKTQKELEDSTKRELMIIWVKSVSMFLVGLVAALLLIRKKKTGRIIAMSFATGMLLLKVVSLIKYWRVQSSPKYWATLFEYFPAQTIQNLISIIVFGATLVLLSRPSLAAEFRKTNEHNKAFNTDAE